ncbi:MAG TPA: NADH-quinone oxidoreductase subunit L [Actinomycetota bacterium]|nr:NADH-quinone oxidoreductase subunit L [Actinomycetota bacterium]
MIEQAWLIPVIPLAATLLIVFFGKREPLRGAGISILATGAAFVISVAVFVQVLGGAHAERSWPWFEIGDLRFEIGMNVDGLAAVMFVVVTLVSLLVQIYSVGYMAHEPRFTWYFAALSLFTGSMLNLVIANDLFQLLVGWELVGICSYLLIGHFWEEKENADAANKAFITTRTGDVPFVFGIFVLTFAAGTTNITEITELAQGGAISAGALTVAALLLFGGAIGKSAQFPLHVWLPDAMAGPTPVSALIHAATMVAAGVYMVGRLFGVFAGSAEALTFVAVIGAITMLIAALLALVQDDIKRVLAYSTVSQLGYMMAALGLGPAGYTAGLFHLFTHAFFKALLFLGAGSVIHAVHSNRMSEMGGLRTAMPVTFWTFIIGSAALAGIPPLAGFWSKDEIIVEAFREAQYGVWIVAVLTALLTAFYMTRAIALTFFGDYRGQGHPHESPRVMTVPLVALAGLAAVAGFYGAPFLEGGFSELVHFGEEAHAAQFDLGMAALSVGLAAVGIAAGWALYGRWRERDPLRSLGPLYAFLDRKYFLDDVYLRGIVRPIQYPIAAFVNWTSRVILDGIVNGFGILARLLGRATEAVDRRVVDGAVNRVAVGTGWTGALLRYVQSGNVQRYAVFLFVGVAVLAVIFTRV